MLLLKDFYSEAIWGDLGIERLDFRVKINVKFQVERESSGRNVFHTL